MKSRSSINMTEGPLFKNILRFSVPILLTTLLQLLFHSADLIVVGNFAGSNSLAAVGATGSISGLIVNLFMGLSVGASVTVAHALGAGDGQAAHRAVHTAMPLALIGGVVLTAAGILLARPLLTLMSTPADVIDKATLYMQIYFAGVVAILVYNFGAAILRAAGDSKSPLIFLTIAGVLNVILNIVFVAIFDMDVAGVALATSLTNGLSAVLVVLALMRRSDGCKLFLQRMRIRKEQLMKILKIGIPAGIQSSLFSLANTTIQSSVNSFGSVVMSGSSAASNIESFVGIANTAFSQTAINFVGQNMGAKNYKRLKQVYYWCLLLAVAATAILGLLAFLFKVQLLSIYIPDSDEAIRYGMIRMTIMCLLYPVAALMDVTANALRGMGRSLQPTLVSVLFICGFRLLWIFTVFQIPRFHTIESIYIAFPLSWALAFIVHFITYQVTYRKLMKKQAVAA